MGKKVLIADDAPIMRLMIKDIVETSGFEVVAEAENGNDAIEKYKEFKPDVMTMDIVMPEKTGIEALEEILRADPNAKVIMVTAIDQRDSLMKAIRLGAIDYIVKPFDDDRVLSAVTKAIAE